MKTQTTLSCLLLSVLGLWTSAALAAKVNLGLIDPAEMVNTYPDFEQSLNRAIVGVPGAMLAGGKDHYGYYENPKDLDFVAGKKAPVVVYMHGSGQAFDHSGDYPKLKWDYGYAEWITQAGYIFVAPDA